MKRFELRDSEREKERERSLIDTEKEREKVKEYILGADVENEASKDKNAVEFLNVYEL